MPGLTFIPHLSQSSAVLLEAAGVDRPSELARQEAEELHARLMEINAQRHLVNPEPSLFTVRRWIDNARAMATGLSLGADLSDLDAIPEVIVVPDGAGPAGVRPEPLVRRAQKNPDFTPQTAAARPATSPQPYAGAPAPARPAQPAAPQPAPVLVEKMAFRDFKSYEEGDPVVKPLARNSEAEEEAHSRRIKTDKKGELPRTHRRGVMYPHPFYLKFGALIVLSSRLLFLTVLMGLPLVLIPHFMGQSSQYLWHFLWIIGLWVLMLVFQVFISYRIRCRVCTNHIFFSKRCFKNSKAHRLVGLGLVGSLALHALLFSWFRCMYCGTAIRLKK